MVDWYVMLFPAARRVLTPGGLLALDVQEGDGETRQDNHETGRPRFFARYGPDEMAAMVEAAGFAVSTRERIARPTRAWLTFVTRGRARAPRRSRAP
jgi:hypothetical protein